MVAIIDLATSYTAISLVLRVLVVWPEQAQSQQKLNHSMVIQSKLLLSNILPIKVIYSRYILSSDVSNALATKMVRTPNKMVQVTSIPIPNCNSSRNCSKQCTRSPSGKEALLLLQSSEVIDYANCSAPRLVLFNQSDITYDFVIAHCRLSSPDEMI